MSALVSLLLAAALAAPPPVKDAPKAPKAPKVAKVKPSGFSVGLKTESRAKTEPSNSDKDTELDMDFRPKLVGKLELPKHGLMLLYNPRLALPAMGPKAGKLDLLHRIGAGWKWKVSKAFTLNVTQRFDVGVRDFTTPIPPSEPGVDGDPLGEESDEAELSDDEAFDEGDVPVDGEPVADEEGVEEDEPADEELAEELPSDEETEEQLLLVDRIFLLTAQTDVAMVAKASKSATYTTKVGFVRSGALEEAAQKQFPERLSPSLKVDAAYKLGKKDTLTPALQVQYNTFAPSEAKDVVGRLDATYKRRLFGKSDFKAGLGVGTAYYEDKKLKEIYIVPDAMVGLTFDLPLHGTRLKLGVTGALGPYVSPASGKTTPRVSGSLSAVWKTPIGFYTSVTSGVTSNLTTTELDPQGFSALFNGALGWTFAPHVSIEAGARFQHTQKPERAGVTPDPTQRVAYFGVLTVDSGLLP